MHLQNLVAIIAASSLSFVAAAPAAIEGREAAPVAKPGYGSRSLFFVNTVKN
jgi:hypothetical protein